MKDKFYRTFVFLLTRETFSYRVDLRRCTHIPKTQKMELDASLLNTQDYKVHIKGKWSNPGKEVAPSPIPRCNSS